MGQFDGKVVIVTGAGGGVGRAHALAFAAEGARVVVNDLGGSREGSGTDSALADQVVAAIREAGGTAVPNYDNVATVEGGLGIFRTAMEHFGQVDVLVNNAGIIRDKSFRKMDEGMWDLVMAVHTKQLFAVTQPVYLHMLERGEGGSIINTTSLAGLLGNFGQANYATAKAGVAGFTRTLAMEGRKAGIRVNAVAPVAKTRMTDDISMVPDEMLPEHISPMVVYLASDASKSVTGRVFGVHGNQMFEYKMTQTPGVTKDGLEPWTQGELAAQFAEITRDEAAAAGGDSDGNDEVSVAFAQIPGGYKADAAGNWNAVLHWVIKGGADQTLAIADGACAHSVGLNGSPTCTVKTDTDTVVGMFQGKIDPTKAFMSGKITADNLPDMMKMGGAFDFEIIGAAIAKAFGAGEATAPKAEAKAVDWASLIGRRYDADFVMTDAESMAAYALATNDPNPRYAVGPDQVAPPLYTVRLFHKLMFTCTGDPDLNLNMLKLVHGEEDITWHGHIRPKEIVNIRAELEAISQKSKGLVCAWRMYGIVEGKTRVEVRMSVFVRGQMLAGLEPGTTLGTLPPGTPGPDGEPSLTDVMDVAADQAQRYAAASLDNNPIHLDEETAQRAGLPSVILHGLCTMAFGSKAIVDGLLDGDSSRLRRYAVRFSRPVLLGEQLTTGLWASTPAGDRAGYALAVANRAGEPVISNGWVEIDPA